MKRGVVLMMATAMVLGMTACGGGEVSSEGRIGDTMETYFFDFTINSASLTGEYAGRTPEPGNALLVAEVTVKNTYRESIEMYDTDFQLGWGDAEEDYCYRRLMRSWSRWVRRSCPAPISWLWTRSVPASWCMRSRPVRRISPSRILKCLTTAPKREIRETPISSTSPPGRTLRLPCENDQNKNSAAAVFAAALLRAEGRLRRFRLPQEGFLALC